MNESKATRGKTLSSEYVAGFFDADGGVNIYRDGKKKTSYTLTVSIYNTKREIIDALVSTYGGYIRYRKRDNSKWADAYEWKSSANKALSFLQQIYPHLIVKRNRVKIAIEFQTLKQSKRYRFAKRVKELSDFYEMCYQHMRFYNQKGSHPQRLSEEALKREATVRTALKNADLSRNDSSSLLELRKRGLKGAAANKAKK